MRTSAGGVRCEWVGDGATRLVCVPGLGARGAGFSRLASILSLGVKVGIVDLADEGRDVRTPRALAEALAQAVGEVDGVVASSMGGLVAAHFAERGWCRGVAFLGSFTRLGQLGWRGRCFAGMGPVAVIGRPGRLAASLAAAEPVPAREVAELVPTTAAERWDVWRRAWAVAGDVSAPGVVPAQVACVAIQGGRDVLVPPATMPRLLRDLPAGTPAHVLSDAGHVPYWSHPWDVARLLAPWIERLK